MTDKVSLSSMLSATRSQDARIRRIASAETWRGRRHVLETRQQRDTRKSTLLEEPERPPEPIRIERDAQRPATILRVAGEYEERGAKILELFKEIRSTDGSSAVMPIHLSKDDRELFVEVSTRPWNREAVESALRTAATVRSSEHAGAELEILSAYPCSQRDPVLLRNLSGCSLSTRTPARYAREARKRSHGSSGKPRVTSLGRGPRLRS